MPSFRFVNRGHLGGYIAADEDNPHGDPATYCPQVWDWLISTFHAHFVLDVGCGEGHAVKHFQHRGCNVLGIEGCSEALRAAACSKERIVLHDYTRGPVQMSRLWEPLRKAAWNGRQPQLDPNGTFIDVAWCCEFVEHIEERYVDNFLATFDWCRVVAMTHAFPGQAGHHHVNCQPKVYWLQKMTERGFSYEPDLTRHARSLDNAGHWQRSGLIFTKESDLACSIAA